MLCSVVGTSQSSPVNFAEALSLLIFPWLRVGEMAKDLPVSGFWSCIMVALKSYLHICVGHSSKTVLSWEVPHGQGTG